ncbi:MAG: response regulator [Bdellovibrionaceae bacterium]|nr:response regulator [Pseudobdellovibrionaceae bacterium]
MQKNLKKWILIVDDDKDLVDLYESFLELHFADTVKFIKAEDGLEATSKLPFQAFDLIITDLNMPKKTGQAFIQAIKESQMNEHTPVVVITGEETTDVDPQKVTILLKPLDQKKFVDVVANQLKLGKTDQRVAADLLNTFIESGHYLLDKAGGLEVTQLTPLPKKDGEEVEGDFLVHISIKVGKIKNSFLFAFDGNVVKRLAHKNQASSESEYNKIVQAAGDTIVRYSIKKYKNQSIQILNGNIVSKESAEYSKFKRSKGLKIPLRTPLGIMTVYGLM